MSYYTDLDEDLGVDAVVAEWDREWKRQAALKHNAEQSRINAAVRKALAAHGITKADPKDTAPTKPKAPYQPPRGKMVDVHCKGCGDKFQARLADRKRGWGKYCSKSCKAKVMHSDFFWSSTR